jgi:uncharacterized short protein YbdD (DUF466 family)
MFKKIIQILLGQPTGYVSETDKFLAEQRKKHPQLSASQQAEVANHAKIAQLRDGHPLTTVKTELWRDF